MRKPKGMTLIELMITVAIVGILASIAYPSYRQYVLRSNRTDAKVALMQNAQALERCFTQTGAYDNAACVISANSEHGYYTIAATQQTPTLFTLTATATGNQADDTACFSFTIDNTGAMHAKDNGGATSSSIDAACVNR